MMWLLNLHRSGTKTERRGERGLESGGQHGAKDQPRINGRVMRNDSLLLPTCGDIATQGMLETAKHGWTWNDSQQTKNRTELQDNSRTNWPCTGKYAGIVRVASAIEPPSPQPSPPGEGEHLNASCGVGASEDPNAVERSERVQRNSLSWGRGLG